MGNPITQNKYTFAVKVTDGPAADIVNILLVPSNVAVLFKPPVSFPLL